MPAVISGDFSAFDRTLDALTPTATVASYAPARLPPPALPPAPAAARPVTPPITPPTTGAEVRATAEYGKAFASYLRTGGMRAALTTDIETQGGYLAPPKFVEEVVKALYVRDWFRKLARVLPPTPAPFVKMPVRTAESTPFVWGTEISQPALDDALTVGQEMTLAPHYVSGEFELSRALVTAGPLADRFIRDEIAENLAKVEERAFLAGDGVNKPHGLFVPSNDCLPLSRDVAVSPANFAEFFRAKMTLKAAYLRSESLRWIMHPSALLALASLKDAAGAPIFEDIFETPDGRPRICGTVVELSDFAPVGSGVGGAYQLGDYFAVLGDLQEYVIVDNGELAIGRFDDWYYDSRNKVGYIVRRKVDGTARVAEAFVRLKVA